VQKCGRLWTFATDRKLLHEKSGWSTGTSIKLGRPSMPAVEEVLLNRDDDGWFDAGNPWEMRNLSEQIKAGRI
jgi:hypothetical protein